MVFETIGLQPINKRRLWVLRRLQEIEDDQTYSYDEFITQIIEFMYENLKIQEPPHPKDLVEKYPEKSQEIWRAKYPKLYGPPKPKPQDNNNWGMV